MDKNDIITRLSEALKGNDAKQKYYVYMLLDKNDTPFYIGKGEDDRVFKHEQEAELKKEIKLNHPERNVEFSAKDKVILGILAGGREVKKVIVKWGLTDHEALMCESALINMYDFLNPGKLTNIVNGHASENEKRARNADNVATKARTVEDFLKYVAIEDISFKDFRKEHRLEKEHIMFITNNTSVDCWAREFETCNCSKEEFMYDSIRGFWRIDPKQMKKCRYVVGLYRGIVTGVYCVNENCWGTLDGSIGNVSMPTYPEYFRKSDRLVRKHARYSDYLKEYNQILTQNTNHKYGKPVADVNNSYNKSRKRYGFDKFDEAKLINDPNYSAYSVLKTLIGKHLKDVELKGQNPVKYNRNI